MIFSFRYPSDEQDAIESILASEMVPVSTFLANE
jgi:hypothetical protein